MSASYLLNWFEASYLLAIFENAQTQAVIIVLMCCNCSRWAMTLQLQRCRRRWHAMTSCTNRIRTRVVTSTRRWNRYVRETQSSVSICSKPCSYCCSHLLRGFNTFFHLFHSLSILHMFVLICFWFQYTHVCLNLRLTFHAEL